MAAKKATSKRAKRVAEMTPNTARRHSKKQLYPGVKMPRSAYLMYLKTTMQERREADPNHEVFATMVAREWKNLADRSRYEEMAREDHKRFLRDLEAKGLKYKSKRPSYMNKMHAYRIYIKRHQLAYREKHNVTYIQAHNALNVEFNALPDDNPEKQECIKEADRINLERSDLRKEAEDAEKKREEEEAKESEDVKYMTE